MNVFQSWTESLTILKPKNLKLFALVTLKSIVEIYKQLFKDFWWLLLLYCVCDIGFAFFNDRNVQGIAYLPAQDFFMKAWGVATVQGLYFIIFFLIFLLARASVPKKNYAYFKKYWMQALYVLLFFSMLLVFFVLLAVCLFMMHSATGDFMIRLFDLAYKGFVFSFVPFFIFFLLDSPRGLRSFFGAIKKAGIMVVYNYPLCLLFSIVFYEGFLKLAKRALFYMCDLIHIPHTLYLPENHVIFLSEHIVNFILLLLCVVPLSFFASFYIKRLHEQFTVYYDVKG